MAKIKMHAGDFGKGSCSEAFGFVSYLNPVNHKIEGFSIKDLASVAVASEESVKKMGGTVGWGTAGLVVFGPLGLLAGLLMGGNKKEVTFVAALKDGRKFLGTTDSKFYTKLAAACF